LCGYCHLAAPFPALVATPFAIDPKPFPRLVATPFAIDPKPFHAVPAIGRHAIPCDYTTNYY
jgi:hypothetical protein